MITAAYTPTGREIRLPKTGRVRLPAGTMIREGAKFRTLEQDSLLIRGSEWDSFTQARDYHEEIKAIGR